MSRGASASAASKPTQPVKKKRRGAPKDERLDTKNNAERLLRLALIPSIEEALMYKQVCWQCLPLVGGVRLTAALGADQSTAEGS